jgi:hypothetical protein
LAGTGQDDARGEETRRRRQHGRTGNETSGRNGGRDESGREQVEKSRNKKTTYISGPGISHVDETSMRQTRDKHETNTRQTRDKRERRDEREIGERRDERRDGRGCWCVGELRSPTSSASSSSSWSSLSSLSLSLSSALIVVVVRVNRRCRRCCLG